VLFRVVAISYTSEKFLKQKGKWSHLKTF